MLDLRTFPCTYVRCRPSVALPGSIQHMRLLGKTVDLTGGRRAVPPQLSVIASGDRVILGISDHYHDGADWHSVHDPAAPSCT